MNMQICKYTIQRYRTEVQDTVRTLKNNHTLLVYLFQSIFSVNVKVLSNKTNYFALIMKSKATVLLLVSFRTKFCLHKFILALCNLNPTFKENNGYIQLYN